MRLYLRNKMTGEIRDVEADSDEFRDVVKQVTPGGLPMWEQTNYPHVEGIKDRAAYGELNDEDLGAEQQEELRHSALLLDAKGVKPEENPHLQLTPAEIEMGMTPRSKLSELQQMYDDQRIGARQAVIDRASDHIADERKERESAVASKGQSARAGGTDERFNPSGEDESDSSDSSDESKAGSTGGSRAPAGSAAGSSGAAGGGDV